MAKAAPKTFLRRPKHPEQQPPSSGKKNWLPPFWQLNLVFWAGGLLVGLAAVLLAIVGERADLLFQHFVYYWPMAPLLISPCGFALIIYITRRYFPGSQGSGIPQAINALKLNERAERKQLLSLRIALGNFLVIPAFLVGASLGREGPTVQVGASIMLALSRFANFKIHDVKRGLIMAGGAAGIAAAFNTPLAGVVFAIEELSKSFEHRVSETILITVILAGVVCNGLLGDYSYFGHAEGLINNYKDWIVVPIAGVIGGVLGGLFSTSLIYSMKLISQKLKNRRVLFAATCGLGIALIGIYSNGITYGSGYHEAKLIMAGTHVPGEYPFLKMLATLVTYISGIPAGIFAPSLSAGAGLGQLLSQYLTSVNAGVVIVLTMCAYFCGVTQSPITCFAIVMEMVDRNDLILPLMAVALIAKLISSLICREPIYEALATAMLK